ncbi:metal-dependent hydrolase [Psychromonas antarctica]|uniref:metal-dependent hydrolase n=1 Tax=Psychromonas antarctica TaxID=67573 RepID=UPI001EE8C79A|nr:metal-dependent hydrolase [Psychromonas antarctica]MCG6201432.1 metal-dependent hydrolase [Psychromonas antarctica]
MANFNTHIYVVAASSGLASAALLTANHIDLNSALWLWFLGSLGGLLPDIDSDNSTSLDSIFTLLTLSVILSTIYYLTKAFAGTLKFSELIIAPLLIYALLRYLIRPLFEKLTIHRGSCHSLFFLLLVALLTTQIIWRYSPNHSSIVAWLSGGFLFMGGVIHLLLDEICSVDLGNSRIKRSFGSAMKLADFSQKYATLLIFASIVALAWLAPPTQATLEILTNWSRFKL